MIQLTLANQSSPGNYRPTLKVLQKQVLKNNWIPGCWKKYLNKFNSTHNWLEFIKNSRCRKKFSGKIQIKTGIFTNAAFGNERCLIYPKFGGKTIFHHKCSIQDSLQTSPCKPVHEKIEGK